ncbi:hypothetical protein ACLB2K_035488 [Fragaria x ananassa]
MAARLVSSLTLARGKKAVDLRPSKGKSLSQAEVFLVGKLITARDFNRGFFMRMCTTAWQLNDKFRVEPVEGGRVSSLSRIQTTKSRV